MESFISYWIRNINPDIKNDKDYCITKNKKSVEVLIEKYCSYLRGDAIEFPPSIVYSDALKIASYMLETITRILKAIEKVKTTFIQCDSMFIHNSKCYESDIEMIKESYIERSKGIIDKAAVETAKTGDINNLKDIIKREISIYKYEFK